MLASAIEFAGQRRQRLNQCCYQAIILTLLF